MRMDSRPLKNGISQFHVIHGRSHGVILSLLGRGRLIKSQILGPTGRVGIEEISPNQNPSNKKLWAQKPGGPLIVTSRYLYSIPQCCQMIKH